jgi:pilus assembly protein CpaB
MSRNSVKSIKVVRAVTEIKSGDEITKDIVQEVNMASTNQPDTVIKRADEAIGKYAAMDMIKDDYILSGKISDTPYMENTYLNGLGGTKRAISVTIKSLATGLSGKLKSGDIVSVIAPNYKKTGITAIPNELQYVEVIAATSKTGTDTGEQINGSAERELPSTVTLLVSEKQSMLLAELEAYGEIHLALVYRGTKENAGQFLKAQEELNGKSGVPEESGGGSIENNE